MKKINEFMSMAVVVLSMSMVACSANAAKNVTASKNIVGKTENVGNVKAISLHVPGKVIYSQSAATPLQVKGPDNVLNLLSIKNVGGTLTINYKDKNTRVKLRDDDDLVFTISSPQINAMKVTGSGEIEVNGQLNVNLLDLVVTGSGDIDTKGIKARGITATVVGSGDIKMDMDNRANTVGLTVTGSGDVDCVNLTTRKLEGTVTGSGDIEVKGGLAERCDFAVTGSGDIKARTLEAGVVTAAVSGSGDVVCHAADTLNTEISGSGSVRYTGNPTTVNDRGRSKAIKIQ